MISICPPYGDLPKAIVLHHISQLSSLLPENADVITVFQIGFIGIWGETCDDAFSPQNDCAPLVRTEQKLALMHYSYLNASYNNNVNNDWQTNCCMDTTN